MSHILKSVWRSSSFLRDITSTFVRQIASGLVNLAIVVLVARILGPAGSGAYAVALLLPTMLATFLNLGASSANVYFLASRRIDLRTAFLVTTYLSLACALCGIVIGGGILFFFREAVFPGVGGNVLFLALASFPFMLILAAAGGVLQGLQDFRAYNLTLLAPPIVTLVGAIILAITGRLDLVALMASHLLGQVVGIAATAGALLRRPEWRLQAVISTKRRYSSLMISYGLKAYASNVVTFFNYRADLFLVNFLLGPSAAGIYVIAMQFGEKLWLLSQAISTVFLPKISSLAHDEEQRRRITPLIARWTLLLTLIAAIALAVAFNPVVKLVVGEEFSAATLVLWLLLPGIVAWAPARVLANDIAGRGSPEINLLIACVVMVSNLVGNLALIPVWGLSGAAISTCIAYCVMLFLTSRSYAVLSGVHWRNVIDIGQFDIGAAREFICRIIEGRRRM